MYDKVHLIPTPMGRHIESLQHFSKTGRIGHVKSPQPTLNFKSHLLESASATEFITPLTCFRSCRKPCRTKVHGITKELYLLW